MTNTIVTKFDLVCDSNKILLQQMIVFAFSLGCLVAALNTSIADKYGRKNLTTICIFLNAVMMVALIYAPDPILLCVLFGIEGIFAAYMYYINFNHCLEIVSSEYKSLIGAQVATAFCMGGISGMVDEYFLSQNN